MAFHASADLLQLFKDLFGRPDSDAAFDDARIYRLLSLGQQQTMGEIAALFPRMLMSAPHQWTSSDGGLTYQSSVTDGNGNPIYPMGHAEVYIRSTTGYDYWQLYGSSYGGGGGDVVFEGNTLRLPNRYGRTWSGTVWVRCVQTPEAISASTQPTLQPPIIRPLIVYQALMLAADRGGQRDPKPYESMWQRAWTGVNGTGGYLAMLATQYSRSSDVALEGIAWWRAHMATLSAGVAA